MQNVLSQVNRFFQGSPQVAAIGNHYRLYRWMWNPWPCPWWLIRYADCCPWKLFHWQSSPISRRNRTGTLRMASPRTHDKNTPVWCRKHATLPAVLRYEKKLLDCSCLFDCLDVDLWWISCAVLNRVNGRDKWRETVPFHSNTEFTIVWYASSRRLHWNDIQQHIPSSRIGICMNGESSMHCFFDKETSLTFRQVAS